jgi:hypothetical protein
MEDRDGERVRIERNLETGFPRRRLYFACKRDCVSREGKEKKTSQIQRDRQISNNFDVNQL